MHLLTFIARMAARPGPERGSTLAEYAMLVALIAVTCIAAVTALGQEIASTFERVAAAIQA